MGNAVPARCGAHICLGVCTYQRPQMLVRCLLALQRLAEPDDVRLSIVVVDNEPFPAVAELVQAFGAKCRPVLYVNERRRGIAQARNAVLEKAAELRADWVAMIDDDQLVAPDWLVMMWRAQRLTRADVVSNTVEDEYPEPLPVWAFPRTKKRRWDLGARGAATNGVLFRAGLMGSDSAPLRFDTRFALTGGEDRDFFARAILYSGARIIVTPEAVSVEVVPASKLSYGAQVWRSYWMEAVNVRQDRQYYGPVAYIAKVMKILSALVNAIWALVCAPFAALKSGQCARKYLLKSGKQAGKAAGIMVGLAGPQPQPYRTIHGS